MTTYVYHITAYPMGALDIWMPCSPSQVKTPYSLHIYNPNNTSLEETIENSKLNLYPNPTNNSSTLEINSLINVETTLNIFDISGKVVYSEIINLGKGINLIPIHSNYLSSGAYFINVEIGNKPYNIKLIKITNE